MFCSPVSKVSDIQIGRVDKWADRQTNCHNVSTISHSKLMYLSMCMTVSIHFLNVCYV